MDVLEKMTVNLGRSSGKLHMHWIWCFLLCGLMSCGQLVQELEISGAERSPPVIHLAPTLGQPRLKVVWIHGLNNSPRTLLPLAEHLATKGITSYVVQLSGHRPDSKPGQSDFAVWMKEIANAHILASNDHPRTPVITAGYSMGGALAVVFARRARRDKSNKGSPALASDGLLLLAPAIKLPVWYSLTYPMSVLEPLGIPIPSLVPTDARAHRYTSITTYKEFGKARAEVLNVEGMSRELMAPMAVIYHPDDRLVPSASLLPWLERSWQGRYRTYAVVCDQCYARHLFLRPEDMTKVQWKKFVRSVEDGVEFVADEVRKRGELICK